METINCILCRTASEDPVVIEENGFTGRKCTRCALIYISPRPTFSHIVELYKNDAACFQMTARTRGSRLKHLQARHNLSIVERYATGRRLLELGSGGGDFLREARTRGFDVYGIELTETRADYINDELRIPCDKRVLADAFDNMTFDVIYHCAVLSHFYDPVSEFREMNRKLNQGGIMVFQTGNFGDVQEKYYSQSAPFQYPDHLFFFSEESLRHLLDITGFEPIAFYGYSTMHLQRIVKFAKRVLSVLKRWRNRPHRGVEGPDSPALAAAPQAGSSAWRRMCKNVVETLCYLVFYKMGYVLPKKGRPQAVIVVARKRRAKDGRDGADRIPSEKVAA